MGGAIAGGEGGGGSASWRKQDAGGALRIHPDDAARLGIVDGGQARVTTRGGEVVTTVELSDTMQPGHLSLPNGLGLDYPDDTGAPVLTGVAPNELTSSDERDWLAGTPHHKHVKARVSAVVTEDIAATITDTSDTSDTSEVIPA